MKTINAADDAYRNQVREEERKRLIRIYLRTLQLQATIVAAVGGLLAFWLWFPSPWWLVGAGPLLVIAGQLWELIWMDLRR